MASSFALLKQIFSNPQSAAESPPKRIPQQSRFQSTFAGFLDFHGLPHLPRFRRLQGLRGIPRYGSFLSGSIRWVGVAILMTFLSALVSSCVTVDEQGNPLDEKKNAYWNLQKLPEGPFWSEREKDIPFLVVGLPSDLPQRFVLENVPEPQDQGRLAAGTAYAAGYLLMSMRERKVSPNYTCSPEFIYNSLNGGKNVGLEILEVMEFLKGVGCADRSQFSTVDPFIRPDQEDIAAAHGHRIQGFARVDLARPTHIMANLMEGRPVIVTLQVSENFLSLDDMEWKKPEGIPVGRHTVALIGFDRSKEVWIFQNSAGEDWGHNGRFSLHRQWFSRLATQGYVAW